MSEINPRFAGVFRLYGPDGFDRLTRAHVCVVGLGGVGSWTVESLARSGIGALTLVDLDDICVSNVNRQIHALENTIGQSKGETLAARVRLINPDCRVTVLSVFFKKTNAEEILSTPYDFVVDAIDGVAHKARLIGMCKLKNIPVITCGGAGGKTDAAFVKIADLTETIYDPLMAFIRKRLRKWFQFPKAGRKFGVPCVFSAEQVFGADQGNTEAKAPGVRANCDYGLGAAAHVTGTFGLMAAGYVVNRIVENNQFTVHHSDARKN